MPFVKLDCGILNSTLWFERTSREIFITALLMAEPFETTEPMPQIATRTLDFTGWCVPPGWYGFVPAASVGILHRAGIEFNDQALDALDSLAQPESASRSKDFEGRRLVRVDGGFLILNYMKYRERDYTSAERSKRYRKRLALRRDNTATHRDITQAEAEEEVEADRSTTNQPDPINKPENEKERVRVSGLPPPQEKPSDEVGRRAAKFLNRYAELYPIHRKGARFLPKPSLDYSTACDLVKVWDDDRLEKLAIVFLKTDHEFAQNGSRTIRQFAALASWCDDRLREVEVQRGR